MRSAEITANEKVATVSELTRQVKALLEQGFASVWVSGEVSNLTRPSSGHLYWTLKDAHAQLRAVMWRSTVRRLRFDVREGLQVIVRGSLNVYPPRGEYQLLVDELHPKGIGAQDLALRQLKEKLLKLGYFAVERKRPVPAFPGHIALVTSPSGAAIRDMLEILGRRWPAAQVWVCPVRVQGPGASEEIAAAIDIVNRIGGIEVLILGRGGGSSEDLAAFNHEIVARAIFQSRLPVISAVGHEIDVTIADLVADKRALTPSEAAELVSPDRAQLLRGLETCAGRMRDLLVGRLETSRRRWQDVTSRRVFAEPLERIRDHERRLDDIETRLGRGMRQRLGQATQLAGAWSARLETLSPLNVLARGYSLTRRASDQHVVRRAGEVCPGDRLVTRLAEGHVVSRVEEVDNGVSLSISNAR
jgi:exodeoxyribonuclease VII large subunit